MPIASAVFIRLGGVIARISSTSMIGGNASIRSNVRMIASSSNPRRYPASSPSVTPSAILISVAMAPSSSESCEPISTRLNTSRPYSSVPAR
jgi:hypothetical protein